MTILDYQRLDNILNLLIERDDAISINEISSFCHVSDRTIRSDINTINDYITENGAKIILHRKKGYTLDYQDRELFEKFWSDKDSGTFLFTSSESRLAYLVRLFLTTDHYISQDYLQSILFISVNTLYNDFRALKTKLSPFNLKLQNKSNLGYMVEGKEQDIRNAIINLIFQENLDDYLIQNKQLEKDICFNVNYELFSNLFDKHITNHIEFDSDYFRRNIFSTLLLAISRIKYKKNITTFDQVFQLNPDSLNIINNFINDIKSSFEIEISENELRYIYLCFAENQPSVIDDHSLNENDNIAQSIVNSIKYTLSNSTDSVWPYDKILEKNLLEHIKLFLKIQTIDANRNNPIIETIKKNFPYAFDLAIQCSQNIVTEFDIHFSEDEISYIALHLANSIERNTDNSTKQYTLAIICGSGKTFSSIIETKIKRRFPNRFSSITKLSLAHLDKKTNINFFDLKITTVPIKDSKKSDYIFINIDDLDSSMKLIDSALHNLDNSLVDSNLISEEYFLTVNTKLTKIELLNIVHNKLLSNGKVKKNFLDDILARENISSTLISDTIAIPHPIGNSVKQNVIFPIIAPKGIDWDGKNAKFVFVFAIQNNNNKQMEYIYDQLLDFISSDDSQTKLLKEPTYNNFISIFKTFDNT